MDHINLKKLRNQKLQDIKSLYFSIGKKQRSVLHIFLVITLLIGSFGLYSLLTVDSDYDPPAVVLNWKLDEGYALTTGDSSGQSKTGILSGAAWRPNLHCLSNNCLYFDGTDDTLSRTYSSDTELNPGTGSFSASLWFRHPAALTGTDTLLTRFKDAGYKIYTSSSGLCFGIDDDATGFPEDSACTSTTYADNRWHFVEVVKNGTTSITLYVDGVQVAQDASLLATGSLSGTSPTLYVGNGHNGTISENFWHGFIDEVTVYNTARSASEIKADFIRRSTTSGDNVSVGESNLSSAFSDGLTGHWRLNEGTGTTTEDSSGNIFSGTLTNSPSWNSSGKFNQAVTFASNTNYIDLTDRSEFELNILSISAWVYRTGTCGTVTACSIFSKGSTLFEGYNFYLDNPVSAYVPSFSINDLQQIYGNTEIKTNQWYHLAVTMDTSKVRLYVNGVLDKEETRTQTPSYASAPAKIGNANTDNAIPFEGSIDDVRFYNKRLTSEDIELQFNIGPNPAVHYRFDEISGATVYDSSTNNVTGTIKGTTISASSTIVHEETVTGSATGTNPTSASSASITGVTDHLYIAAIATKSNASTVSSVSGIGLTWNSINTQCGARSQTNIRLYYAIGTPSGNGTVTVNFSSAPSNSIAISVSRYSGVNTSTPIGASVTANTLGVSGVCSGGTDNTSPSVDITTTNANALIYAAVGKRNATCSGGSLTERSDFNSGGTSGNEAGICSGDSSTLTAGIYTPNVTTNVNVDWAISAVEIIPASTTSSNIGIWQDGKYGKSAAFPAGDDHITYTSDDMKQITISMWISSNGRTMSSLHRFVSLPGYELYYDNGDDTIYFRSDRATDGLWRGPLNILPFNSGDYSWYHIVFTYNAGSVSNIPAFYLNGIPQTITTVTTPIGTQGTNSGMTYIGNRSALDRGWPGKIDDYRIYNYVRSQKQVISDMNAEHVALSSTTGFPLAYWKFDDGYGSVANNTGSAGSALNMTVSGPAWTQEGKNNRALSFDGTDDLLTLADTSTLEPSEEMTISAWFRLSTLPSSRSQSAVIVSKLHSVSPSVGYELTINTSNQIVFGWTSSGSGTPYQSATSSSPVQTGTWYHVTAIRNANQIMLFVNAVQAATGTTSDTLFNSDGQITIGAASASSNRLHGTIDEVKFYNYALTSTEVLVEYNQGRGSVYGALSTESNGTTISNAAAREYCVPGDSTACSPPVGEWKLDEKSSNTAFDTSGSANNGTLTGSPVWLPGRIGSGLAMNGTSQYVDFAAGPSTVRTITFWTKPVTTTEFFINVTGTTDYIASSAGTISATGFTAPTIYVNGIATTSIVAGVWQHIAVTTSTAESASNFEIGRTQNTNYLEGLIDDVKLFDYAMTQAQVSWNYNRSKPLAYWQFDETAGTTAFDASQNGNGNPNANNGTLTNTPTRITSGKLNSAISFDGTDDYISVNDSSLLNITSDITLEAWAYPTSLTSANKTVVFKGNSTSNSTRQYGVRLNASNQWEGFLSIGTTEYTLACTLSAATVNQWSHIVFKRSSSNADLYINGRKVCNSAAFGTGTINSTANILAIGRYGAASSEYFGGYIDNVRLYNIALTDAQVLTIMNEGAVKL